MEFLRSIIPVCAVAVLSATAACDRPAAAPRTDTATRAATVADSLPAAAVDSGWSADAGAFLLLPGSDDAPAVATLLRPDATDRTVGDTSGLGVALGDRRVALFSRSGIWVSATVGVSIASVLDAGCTGWPTARLTPEGGAPLSPWTVGFAAGRVTAVALDSIEGLPPRDSVRLTVDLTRLASAMPDDTSTTFRGLPFVVLRAYRAMALDTPFVVATLARRVNQEDSPKEERVVLIVNMTGTDAKQWTIGWHERAAGREDELAVAEPLMAFRTTSGAEVNLLFGRYDGETLGGAVLSRRAGLWRIRWQSAAAGCR